MEWGLVDEPTDTLFLAEICITWGPVRITVCEWDPLEISRMIPSPALSCAAEMAAT